MISTLIINILDMFNIFYLWTLLSKKNIDNFKLLSSVFVASILTTIIEQLGMNFICTYIVIIMMIKFIYNENLKEIIFQFFLVLLGEISAQLIISVIVDRIVDDYTLRIVIVELTTFACIIVFSKINLKKKIRFHNIQHNILIYFILTCILYVVIFKVVWNDDNNIILNNLVSTSAILTMLVSLQIFAYLFIIKIIKEKEKLKVSTEYNIVINEIVQEIKQRQHDFINYKNTIRGIVAVVDDKDVKGAISNYIKDEEMHDIKINELIYIDNVVIRSIIYRNICKAEKHKVNFQYKIENDVLDNILGYHEISNLLNNLLNNAFDEVLRDGCNEKNIEIIISNSDQTSHLIVKNQVVNLNDIEINEMFTRGYSTKNTTETRGYGLYNVKKIINIHKGYIKINLECGKIIFDIYFNNSSGKSGSP